MKALPRTAGARVVSTELLEQFLVPMHNAVAAADVGFRRVSPSSAYLRSRKQGRLSSSSSRRMTYLLFVRAQPKWPGSVVYQTRAGPGSQARTELPNKGMKLTRPGQLRSLAAYPRCSTDVSDVAGRTAG